MTIDYDVIVVGASLGGVAAALAAAACGSRVCLLEAGTWVGGQFTYQGVCKADDKEHVEHCGSTAAYRGFRQAVRDYYRHNYRLSESGRAQLYLNPGGLGDRRLALNPAIGDRILKGLLRETPDLHLRLDSTITDLKMAGDRLEWVKCGEVRYQASLFVDATELGDLLYRCGRPGQDWVIGAEAQSEFGEPDAPPESRPDWLQPITFPFPLELRPGGNFTIPRPAGYSSQGYTIKEGCIERMLSYDPSEETMFTYRRFNDHRLFDDPALAFDQTMINCSSNDYLGGIYPGSPGALQAARQLSLGYCYWLQTECPRHDSGYGYPELRLMSELFETSPQPYVRESRRIKAVTTVTQQDVEEGRFFEDSGGIGMYPIDVHANPSVGMAGIYRPTKPFQIPLGALLPRRLDNLLPACKNLGVTHITNGCYRLHPIEWNIGETTGVLAARAATEGVRPRDLWATASTRASLQDRLLQRGIPLVWCPDVGFEDPLFAPVQRLMLKGILPPGIPLEGDGTGCNNGLMRLDEVPAVREAIFQELPEWLQTRREMVAWLASQGPNASIAKKGLRSG